MCKMRHKPQEPIPPSLQNAVHQTVLYHLMAAVLPVSKDLLNVHGSYHQPGDAVSDNACVRLLPGCQNTLLFFRHEDELYHLVKSEHLSRVFCDLCSHRDNPELPEAALLYVSFQTLPSLS